MTEQFTTLQRLQELRQEWRRQNFQFTAEQQQAYDILSDRRREHVKQYYAEGCVFVGSSGK